MCHRGKGSRFEYKFSVFCLQTNGVSMIMGMINDESDANTITFVFNAHLSNIPTILSLFESPSPSQNISQNSDSKSLNCAHCVLVFASFCSLALAEFFSFIQIRSFYVWRFYLIHMLQTHTEKWIFMPPRRCFTRDSIFSLLLRAHHDVNGSLKASLPLSAERLTRFSDLFKLFASNSRSFPFTSFQLDFIIAA